MDRITQATPRKAYARMTNTFFEKGTDKLEDMIKSIEHGYMLFETNINIAFDDKNLPIPHKKQGEFGEYTIYFSPSGKKIHYKKGCCNAICPEFRFNWHGSECSKCVHYKPKLPITAQQYYEYIKIIESLQKYNINIKGN